LGNNGRNFGRNQTSYLLIYKLPNLDLKQGISYLEREGERETERKRDRHRERGRERQKEREIDIERGGERDRKKER
jgi:hypothetical protein